MTGTCAGTTPNTLAAGATALSFTGITIPASGNCTVIFSVTSNTAGAESEHDLGRDDDANYDRGHQRATRPL